MPYRPLADEIRPQTLDEVVGQRHILGKDGLLRRIIDSGSIPNLIFYGPSGTGKTTVANIIAKRTNRPLHRLNATTASISDIKDIIGDIGTMLAPDGVLLYLDEIQYFNKKQQQSLLEFMENGKITLIASTTENPYFYVYNAVLSRASVFEFKPLESADVLPAVERGVRLMGARLGAEALCEDGVQQHIASACGGDVRKAMNAVELLLNSARREGDRLLVTLEDARMAAQRSAMRYDRAGDDHYDILSALQKSIRGSDPDAACHYLARLLEAGDLISACRRLMVIACEDVGLAYPQIIPIVKACVDAANLLGLPEARIPLGDAAVLMATAPKSNSAHIALDHAMADVRAGKTGDYPRHLQNRHADSAGQEREQGYRYPHDFPGHWVSQQYLPDALAGKRYYEYGDNKTEQAARRYWEEIKGREGGGT
ncbi:replication-associated recombination protein A [Flavonifractor sp. DFI.6.63]|uniref:Replication-associated recombination protein A n=1 Tax=Lawsonibacter hominis TaxID=2763053 RepID=A0A8J6J5T2_9FIRM|nr:MULTISPECIES: replication-associated recombination protein A [Oscillospiraceae]MBS1384093.1 replication-associated recombination protein A [Flavonifractor sp.]MDU2195896.1 replication-associated recombination protein A [Clostridiales bacterium]MDY2977287.1 replication-associated recombination protein A [Oscillospiraceae bacterium]MBC5733271.1 replication-associated recombination protein A [Lawsonibacter hominis]MCQ5031162.1 replication-associated recombination protein A [Flavonifractor sp. 